MVTTKRGTTVKSQKRGRVEEKGKGVVAGPVSRLPLRARADCGLGRTIAAPALELLRTSLAIHISKHLLPPGWENG